MEETRKQCIGIFKMLKENIFFVRNKVILDKNMEVYEDWRALWSLSIRVNINEYWLFKRLIAMFYMASNT